MAYIIIVEDDPDIRDTLRDLLSDEGYQVHTASHGQEALELLRKPDTSEPDLLMIDLLMPVMDGFALLEAMQRDPNLKSIPTMVLSASAVSQLPKHVGLLRKPIALDLLLSEVRRRCVSPSLSANSHLP